MSGYGASKSPRFATNLTGRTKIPTRNEEAARSAP